MSRAPLTGSEKMREARRRSRGQALAEFGIVLSLLMVLALGIFQVCYLIYQQYGAMNLAREGANLILRQSSLDIAESAIRAAQADPRFDADTRLLLSVVQLGSAGPNAGKPIITQRHAAGMPTGASLLGDPPSSSYGPGPTYTANDPGHDTSIQAKSPLPNGLQVNAGQSVYVAEIWVKRRDIMPLAGVRLPDTLYSIAYF
jgi:TadE-like protein